MPASVRAAIVAGSVAPPFGTTAPGTLLASKLFASETNPKRSNPGSTAEHANSVTGTGSPTPVSFSGMPSWKSNAVTVQMSVARRTSRSESFRNPAPPKDPECGTSFNRVEKAGTSPLLSGFSCAPAEPAGCASSTPAVEPLPSPSKPRPVATWKRPSSAASGPSPPKPGAVLASAALTREFRASAPPASPAVTTGWFRMKGRPTRSSSENPTPGPP
jgi:hypothetical protein